MRSKREKYLVTGVSVLMFKEDLDKLKEGLARSTCRSMGAYCRKLLLGKPVTVLCRNQSFDAFVDEAIALRTEMEDVRKDFPFSKENELRLILLQEEVKKCISKIFEHVCKNKDQ
jgi:hypothetical protein